MLNSLLLTSANAVENVVETTEKTGFTLSMAQMKVLILIALVIIIAVYIIVKPTPEKMDKAKKFLNSLATQIMAITLANIEHKINTYDGTIDLSFDDFKKNLLDVIYEDAWDFVDTAVKQAVEDGKLDSVISKYIKRESVESLVNIVVGRDTVQQKFVEAFNLLFDKYNEQMGKDEEEAAAFAEAAEKEPEEPGDPADDTKVDLFSDTVEDDETNKFNPELDEIIAADSDERDNDGPKSVG